MKKYLITAISCVIICAIVGIVVYCCIPKTNELIVNAQDVSVKVGEKVKLQYSSSIPDAVLTFSVKDKSVAEVEMRGEDVFVTGRVEGSTTINVLARYKDARFEDSVSVVVEKSNTTDNPQSDPQDKDDTTTPDDNNPPVDNPSDDNKPSDDTGNQDTNVPKDEVKITFVENNFQNFSVEGEVITINKAQNAIFAIKTNVNGTVDIESEVIVVSKLTAVGNKAFSLYAAETGEYQITFVINSTYRKIYTVKVI